MVGVFLGLPTRTSDLTPDDVSGAVALLAAHPRAGVGGRDAALLATARRLDVTLLCTADKALAPLARKLGLEVRDLAR